jgi:ADP-heptose:LPS heptosyltransferase
VKVLLIKLGALGDVINSTAIVKKIMEHHSNDDVYLLTTEPFIQMFSHFKNLRIFAFKRKGLSNKIKTICWIRKHKFERLYDLQSNDRTGVITALSGIPYRAGNHPRYPYNKHPKASYKGECHSFERLNQIIESANIQPAKPLPYLPIPDEVTNNITRWLETHELEKDKFVLLHAGSSPKHLNKRWPHFEELALHLKNYFNIVWIGGMDDVELNKQLSKSVGIDATNAFKIFDLVALGKKAKFAITNDSAPMHILSCSQIPVFGLFGPTYPRRTHALGQLENVISANKIMACNDNDFKAADIADISIDMVLDKLKMNQLI